MIKLNINISEVDFAHLGLYSNEISYEELVRRITRDQARKALRAAQEAAEYYGLSNMTLDEINAEVKAVRHARRH